MSKRRNQLRKMLDLHLQNLPMFTGENKEKTQTTKSDDFTVWVL